MLRSALAVAAALAVQAVVVAAIPLHESWIRAHGRLVTVSVDPVDPYDAVRGYHARFIFRGLDSRLPGFDKNAPDGAPAWVVFDAGRPGRPARPVRVVGSPSAGRDEVVLRARYVPAPGACYGCRGLRATPDAWYADQAAVQAVSLLLREHHAVAELRVTPDGDASLLRLRPSGPGMGPGG